jgi:hypothetical protein
LHVICYGHALLQQMCCSPIGYHMVASTDTICLVLFPAVQRVELRKQHQAIMLAIVTSVLRRQLSTAWSAWRAYTLRKRQQQQDLQEVGAACLVSSCLTRLHVL